MIRFPAPPVSSQESIDRIVWEFILLEANSIFARLVRLASYRDPVTRQYFLASAHRSRVTLIDRSLRSWHERIFNDWLVLPLGRQAADLQIFLAAPSRSACAVIDQDLAPDAVSDAERELFTSDLKILAALFQVKPGFPSSARAFPDPRLLSILTLIEETKTHTVSLHTLGAAVGLSGDWLRRRFKEWTGTGLGSVFRRVRVKRAAYLLKSTSMPIKAVAAQCGYDDLSNFSRDFLAVLSIRPTAYQGLRRPFGN